MEYGQALTGAGGALVGLVVGKLLNRTASSIESLPKLEWRVEVLEKHKTDQDIKNSELTALWRELAKAKAWIETAAELAKAKGMDLTTPRWGKEP